MKLSKESNESLGKIRAKVTRKDIDFNTQELLYLDEVYAEITKLSTGKSQVISRGCSSCINNAVNIVYNFVTYHEEKHEPLEKNTPKITTIEVGTEYEYYIKTYKESFDEIINAHAISEPMIVNYPPPKTRNELLKECKEQGIKIPRNATVKQLNELING